MRSGNIDPAPKSGSIDTAPPSVAITHPDAGAAARWQRELAILLPGSRVEVWQPGAAPADYAVGWIADPAFFAAQPRLKALFSPAAGVDTLVGHPSLPPRLPVIRLEDAGMGRQMIEYCCHEVLRVHRRVSDYEAQQRAGVWRVLELAARADFTVGVFGLGVLGTQVAQAIAGLGYPVRGYARSARSIEGVKCFDSHTAHEGHEEHEGQNGLRAFLAGCRVLILLAPLTADTRDLFDAQRLAWLPEGAWLVNVARGALIVDEALLAALDSGHLAGATLDVFREEPLPGEHRYWQHPRVRITPHASARTLVAESARQVGAKIAALERGETVGGIVERERGY